MATQQTFSFSPKLPEALEEMRFQQDFTHPLPQEQPSKRESWR
jgi:hypothetical protein